MGEMGFSQQFALIALNAQDSLNMTTAKKISLRCVAAATVAELYLDDYLQKQGDFYALRWRKNDAALNWHQKVVLETLFGTAYELQDDLPGYLEKVTKLSKKKLKKIEQAFRVVMEGAGTLEEIPALVGCDLYYDDAGITVKEYRSESDAYRCVMESFRAEILEDGFMTDEAVWMLWLLKESSSLYDMFSETELQQVAERYNHLAETHSLASQIYRVDIHRTVETGIKGFLKMKQKAMSSDTGVGLNFLFPFLERSQSVFIETESYFSNKEERLKVLQDRLEKHGHHFTIKRKGDIPLIMVDNTLYEAVPHVAQPSRVPIHGIRLRRYPLSV